MTVRYFISNPWNLHGFACDVLTTGKFYSGGYIKDKEGKGSILHGESLLEEIPTAYKCLYLM